MVIQYENTFEEFSEASRLLGVKKKKASPAKRIVTFAVTIFFFYIATNFWTSYAGMDGTLVFVNLVAPVAITFVVVAIVATSTSLLSGKFPKVTWRAALSAGVVVLLALEFYGMRALQRITHQNPAQSSTLDWRILMPHTGWLFFLTWIMIVTFNNRRKNLRTLWDAQPSLHRLKTADISAEGVVISDDKTRLQYSWLAFVGWQESNTLFLLKNFSKTAYFLPKRAFAGDEEVSAMRALCELIPTSTDVAFPVLTDAEPQPIAAR